MEEQNIKGQKSYFLARWIFIRSLGIIYLIAFVSLWMQIQGLIGSDGILPAHQYLEATKSQVFGWGRFWFFPTLFWTDSSDGPNFSCKKRHEIHQMRSNVP